MFCSRPDQLTAESPPETVGTEHRVPTGHRRHMSPKPYAIEKVAGLKNLDYLRIWFNDKVWFSPGIAPSQTCPSTSPEALRTPCFSFVNTHEKGRKSDRWRPFSRIKTLGPSCRTQNFHPFKRRRMAENKKTKHHGSAKRPHRMEVTFSEKEWERLTELAAVSGEKSLSKFARKTILNGGVVEGPVTAEDRKEIGKLSRIGSNLWHVRKQLHNAGMDENTLKDFQMFYDEFAKIIRYYRAKIDRK